MLFVKQLSVKFQFGCEEHRAAASPILRVGSNQVWPMFAAVSSPCFNAVIRELQKHARSLARLCWGELWASLRFAQAEVYQLLGQDSFEQARLARPVRCRAHVHRKDRGSPAYHKRLKREVSWLRVAMHLPLPEGRWGPCPPESRIEP